MMSMLSSFALAFVLPNLAPRTATNAHVCQAAPRMMIDLDCGPYDDECRADDVRPPAFARVSVPARVI